MAHPPRFDQADPLLARLRKLALALPDAAEKVSHGIPAFYTKKVFAYYGGSIKVGGEYERHGRSVLVLPEPDEREALAQDSRCYVPAYLGPWGWVGLDLDDDTDWVEIARTARQQLPAHGRAAAGGPARRDSELTWHHAGVTDQPLSIQERLYPDLPCFGCGHGNPEGLKLRSYPGPGYDSDLVVVAGFMPWPQHDNGLGYLNGGIITTVMDCHSAAAVTLEAQRQNWPPLPGAALPYVTAGLDVRFLRPSPLHDPVELRAVVTEAAENQMAVDVELVFDGKLRATASALWKRWRPRPS